MAEENEKGYVALPPAEPVRQAFCSPQASPEVLMVMGALVVTCANTTVPLFSISLLTLIAGRCAVQWTICIITLILRRLLTKQPIRFFGPPESRHWLLLRAAVYYAFVWLWMATLRLVSIGDAVTVVKFQCFVTGIGSHFLFGECLTSRWWACSITSLLGVVLVTQPPLLFGSKPDTSSTWGLLLNMLTPLVSGSLPLFIKLAPGAHFMEVQHATDFVSGVLCSPLLLWLFGNPSELLIPKVQQEVFCIALLAMTGLCLFTASYQGGSAGRLALLGYIEVPASYLVQVFVFGGELNPLAMCGAVLITGAAIGVASEQLR